jgi:hypothetical protein
VQSNTTESIALGLARGHDQPLSERGDVQTDPARSGEASRAALQQMKFGGSVAVLALALVADDSEDRGDGEHQQSEGHADRGHGMWREVADW